MKTLKTVEPYAVKYRIWDTVDYGIVYETSDLEELTIVYYEYYTERKLKYSGRVNFPDYSYYHEISVPRYEILTEFGEPVEIGSKYRNYRPKQHYEKPLDVVYTKKNPNKIKKGYYANGQRYYWYSDDKPWHYYPYISRGYYRRIRTQNERRQNVAIISEYGDNVVRGKRRSKQLPNSWDDIPVHSWDYVKSWKHNSKRRHQWKVR